MRGQVDAHGDGLGGIRRLQEALAAAAVRVPEFSPERLEKLKKRYRDGSTHVVLSPLDFIARLAALVPRPRVHLVTYHGVFAPAAAYRDLLVPDPPEEEQPACAHRPDPDGNDDRPRPRRGRRRYSCAELMQRVFKVDVLVCFATAAHRCQGARPAFRPRGPRSHLGSHLELPAEPPLIAAARGPPEAALPFE